MDISLEGRDSTAGAQSLRRALALLRLLANGHEQGMRLSEVITQSGLERSTVHRLLSCLVEERFAERDELTRRYRLGIEAMQIGLASTRHFPLVTACRSLLQKLARISGDTVFFVVREGDYCICLHREEGHFPVKVFTTDIGERRLLGMGAGGLALLSGLSDEEITRVIERHAADYAAAGLSPKALRQAVAQTRKLGYAEISDTITQGVSGVGCVLKKVAPIQAAISFGAISTRLLPPRRKEMGQLLMEQLSSSGAELARA
jgi:DNA-binding IclR family transcriptional regulator